MFPTIPSPPNFFQKIGAAISKFLTKKVVSWTLAAATVITGVKGFRQMADMLSKGQDIMANKTAAGGKIPVIYGTRRVGAQIVYMDTAQNRSKDLFVVYAISVGECSEIVPSSIEIDGNSILDGNIYKGGGYVGSDRNGQTGFSHHQPLNTASQVGDVQYSNAGTLGTNPALRYSFVFNLHHGASSQTADPMLRASIPTEWTTNHKLNGICYIAAAFDYDKKGMYKGVPQITVQVKGKKVYDPRESDHTFGDPSTYEWSSNPALCFLDYITNDEYGKGLAESQINMTAIGTAADKCNTKVDQPYYNGSYQDVTWSGDEGDDFIVIDDNADWWQNKVDEFIDIRDVNDTSIFSDDITIKGSTRYEFYDSTQENRLYIDGTLSSTYTNEAGSAKAQVKRFHCNGYIDTNKNVMDNAKELLANMRGILNYVNGKYELQIEDTGTSTFSITDDHIIADAGISVDYGNKDKKANKVVIEFFNANKKYELDTATVLHDATPEYYSDDGEVLEIKAEFPYVTDPYIAYNMGKAILTRSRNQTTMQFLGTPEMYKLNVGDIVDLTYSGLGFSAKPCRVEALELQANGLVSVSLIEYFDVYTWEVPAQESVEILAKIPTIGALKPPQASSIVFTDTDDSPINRPTLTWTEPTDFPVKEFRVDVEDTSNPPVQVFSKLVNTNSVDLSFLPTGNYNAIITSINGVGIESADVTKAFTIGDPPTATADIQDDAVVTDKITDDAITTPKILDNAVTDAKINSLTANKITAGTIDASVITVTNLDADNITSGSIGADKITVTNLAAIESDLGDIDAGSLNIGSGAFVVTTEGDMTAKSADVVGNLKTGNLVVTGDAGIHGEVRATSITAETVTVESIKQEVWNEIDRRTAPAQNGFYDDFSSTGTDGYYVGVAKNFDLLGTNDNGYQINSNDIDLRAGMVTGFATSTNYTGTALEATFQYFYKLASDSTWTALTPTYTGTTDKYTTPDGYFYELDADPSHRINSGTLTAESYYHFRLAVTPTVTNNVWTDSDAGSGYKVEYGVQQSSTGTGTGTGTVTSVSGGDGITASPSSITTTGSLAVDSTVVRTTGTQTIGGDKTFSDDIVIQGNLDVQGTTTTIDTTNLDVKDKNITLNYGTGDTSANANGAGITIQDAVSSTQDATLTWNTANDSFNFSHNLNFADSIKAQFGNSNDLQIYHNGSASFITENGTGDLRLSANNLLLRSDDAYVQSEDGTVNSARFNSTTGVTLYRANSPKLATTSTGIDITGTVTADGLTVDGNILLNVEGNELQFNTSSAPVNKIYTDDTYTANGLTISANNGVALKSTNNYLLLDDTGTNEMVLNVDGGERMRVTSTGIDVTGTIESTGFISVEGTSGNTGAGTDRWIGGDGTAGTWFYNVPTGSNHYFAVNNSNTLGINSSGIDITGTVTSDGLTVDGTVTIDGGTTDNTVLTLDSSTANTYLKITDSNSTSGTFIGATTNDLNFYPNNTLSAKFASGGDISFYEDTGTTAKLFWDASAESLGIGLTNPSEKLEVSGKIKASGQIRAGSYLESFPSFSFANDTDTGMFSDTANQLEFSTGGSSRLVIDSSGRLLVGKTAVDNTTVGFRFDGSSGFASFVRDGGEPLYLNRKTSDGELVKFAKNGSIVGSIGTELTRLFIGSDDSMIFFDAGSTNAIWPWTSTATSSGDADNTIDIGDSFNRFKDLHLSGTAYANNINIQGSFTVDNEYTLPSASGSAGQVLKYPSTGSQVIWADDDTEATTINNNADNRIITGSGTANTLNAEANFTYDGSKIISTSDSIQGTTFTLANTNGGGGREYTLLSNATGNFYIYDDTADATRFEMNSSGYAKFHSGINVVNDISINATQVITSSRNLVNIASISSGLITVNNVGSDKKISFNRTGGKNISIEHDANQIYFWNNTDSHFLMKMSNAGLVQSKVGFGVNDTTVIDSSRNLTNIGTITSGDIDVSATNTNGLSIIDSSNSSASPLIKVQGNRQDANESQSFTGGLALSALQTNALANDGKHIGTIYFGTNHTNGTAGNIAYSASISARLSGAANSATDMPTDLVFYTGSSGTSLGTPNTTFGTERMRLDSQGRLGLGTSSPSVPLHIETLSTSGTGTPTEVLRLQVTEAPEISDLVAGDGTKLSFYVPEGNQTTQEGAAIAALRESSSDVNAATSLAFYTAGDDSSVSRAMTIESSGNVLVGKTSANDFASAGVQIEPAGQITTSIASDVSLRLNRGGTDGKIIELNKAGTAVGSIGTVASNIYLGTGDTGIYFNASEDKIYPINTSTIAGRDNAIDLGKSDTRFKDLYLSGTTNVSGRHLTAQGGATTGYGFIGDGDSGMFQQASNQLQFSTANQERMRLDSAGNLFINQTATSDYTNTVGSSFRATGFSTHTRDAEAALLLNRLTDDGHILIFRKDNSTVGSIGSGVGDSSASTLYIADAGNVGIRFDQAATDDIQPCNSSGADRDNAINLGASDNRFKDLYLSGNAVVSKVAGVGDTDTAIDFISPNIIAMNTGGTERIRLDASGNLLVGKTSSGALGTAGIELRPNNLYVTSNSGVPIYVNRNTNDGNIIEFRKDNTTVGSIGTDITGNSELYIQGGNSNSHSLWLRGGDCGIRLDGEINTIIPTEETSGGVNNKVNLGSSTYKFKDLHLSGTISSGAITSTGLTVDTSAGTLIIEGFGVGSNKIRSNGSLKLSATGGSVALQHGATERLETTSTGISVTGTISASGSASSTSPTLSLTTTDSYLFNHLSNSFASNLTGGESAVHVIGKAGNTKNSGYYGYYWSGSGSNSNFVSIGHWGADHLFRVYADGTVRASTGRISSYGGGYDVSGIVVIDSSRNLTNIGTISSGAITSTGNSTFSGVIGVGGTLTNSSFGVYLQNNKWYATQYSSSHDVVRMNANTAGGLDIYNQTDNGFANVRVGSLNIEGTTVIDSSRNFINLNSITLNGSLGTWSVNSEGARMNFGRGSANYIDAVHENGYLVFQTSNGETALTLNASQNATFTGDVSVSNITSTGDTTIKPAAGSDALFFNAHNSESQLRLYNNRQDLGNVPVSSIVGYNSVQVSKIQFYRGSGGSSGYINFQVKPQNSESLTDTFQIGDNNTVDYGVNVRAGGYRVGGTTVIDSSRNVTANSVLLSGLQTEVLGVASGELLVGAVNDDDIITNIKGFGGSTSMEFADGTINAVGSTTINHSKSSATNPILALKNTSTTNEGRYLQFLDNAGVNIGQIGAVDQTESNLFISTFDTGLKFESYITYKAILPCGTDGADVDNTIDLGSSSVRFDDIYATNGTIQTSDRNLKQDIQALTEAEQRVATACKGLIRRFRWQDSVAEKDNNPDSDETARYHFGVIAQDLQDAFEAEGLDAGDYGMFISSTWTDDDGNEQTRLGVRYNELLAFIISTL